MDSSREIFEEMVARGFARNRQITSRARYVGHIDVRGKMVRVAIEFLNTQLTNLPKLFLTNRSADLPDAVAHVDENDNVCYAREQEIVLDVFNPKGSIALCFHKMKETLEAIAKHDLLDEIAQEFPQHWGGGKVYIDLPSDGVTSAYVFTALRQEGSLRLISTSSESLRRFGVCGDIAKQVDDRKLPIFVLECRDRLVVTRANRVPKTLADLNRWLDAIRPGLSKVMTRGLANCWPEKCAFLLRGPNGDVGGQLVIPEVLSKAVQRSVFFQNILTNRAGEIGIERFSGAPADEKFMYRRNIGTSPTLAGKNIALVGIGTIGGWLARFLAQTGAGLDGGKLLLLDPDSLEPGNLGRHWLGLHYAGMNKAKAARRELSRTDPGNNVHAIGESALLWRSDLAKFDLVIDATGDQSISDVLNLEFLQRRRDGETSVANLHVWLSGNGAAAQAILVDGSKHACFRCLRLDHGTERFRLLRPDHPAMLTPAACGEGAYIAYGVGAPSVAAGLALQMTLDWANDAPSPRLRTIQLNHGATFKVKDGDAKALDNCPACKVVEQA